MLNNLVNPVKQCRFTGEIKNNKQMKKINVNNFEDLKTAVKVGNFIQINEAEYKSRGSDNSINYGLVEIIGVDQDRDRIKVNDSNKSVISIFPRIGMVNALYLGGSLFILPGNGLLRTYTFYEMVEEAVTVTVQKGAVVDVKSPADVKVLIKDYDVMVITEHLNGRQSERKMKHVEEPV